MLSQLSRNVFLKSNIPFLLSGLYSVFGFLIIIPSSLLSIASFKAVTTSCLEEHEEERNINHFQIQLVSKLYQATMETVASYHGNCTKLPWKL